MTNCFNVLMLMSLFCSDLLSSDYVEIHYEDGKPVLSKVRWSRYRRFESCKSFKCRTLPTGKAIYNLVGVVTCITKSSRKRSWPAHKR